MSKSKVRTIKAPNSLGHEITMDLEEFSKRCRRDYIKASPTDETVGIAYQIEKLQDKWIAKTFEHHHRIQSKDVKNE